MEEASVGRSFDQGINFHEPTAMTMKLSLQGIASRTILFCNTKMLLVSSGTSHEDDLQPAQLKLKFQFWFWF
eukprot:scaffold25148_cov72-Cyclotella_meneghiniana.AAC.2